MKQFLKITDFSTDELIQVLNRADELHGYWNNNNMPKSLEKERIALWFYGNGFRNRMAFEIGARSMGADVSYIPGDLGLHEPIEDIGFYLRNWFSMLVIRAKSHDYLQTIAEDSAIPTINARTSYNHPCEIIGDLQYIRKKRGSLDSLNVIFVGEIANLSRSWLEAVIRFPINLIQVAPEEYLLSKNEQNGINANAIGELSTSVNLDEVISKKTDLIYTDCWPVNKDKEEIKKLFLPYQITNKVLERINDQGIFLPCPPVSRGKEVSSDSLLSKKCKVYEAKEYLLHSQNAIMEFLIKEK